MLHPHLLSALAAMYTAYSSPSPVCLPCITPVRASTLTQILPEPPIAKLTGHLSRPLFASLRGGVTRRPLRSAAPTVCRAKGRPKAAPRQRHR